jgi:hypothetical protein
MQFSKLRRIEGVDLCSEEALAKDKPKPILSFSLSVLIFLFFASSMVVYGQRKSDIGFFTGTSYYMGDINPNRHFYSPGIAFGPIYRYNFHFRNSLRLSGVFHTLKASDADFDTPLQNARNASFSGSYLDLSALYEFNFIPFKTSNRKTPYTFYIASGFSYHVVLSSDVSANSHFTMPFSLGFKANAGKRLSTGIEWSPRKIFYDKMDGVENFSTELKLPLFGNKDWYTFAGIFITYKIFNFRADCPAYD